MTSNTTTAVRTNPGTEARHGADAELTITYSDGTVRIVGGKRAARAAAVLLVDWPEDTDGPRFYGARASLAAAEAEARRLLAGGQHRRPCSAAIVIPVTEAAMA